MILSNDLRWSFRWGLHKALCDMEVLKEKLPLSSPFLPNNLCFLVFWRRSGWRATTFCLVILSSDRDFCIGSGFLWDMKLLRRVFLNTVILDCNKILVMLQMKRLIQFWTLQRYMWKATEKAWRKTVRATWKARFNHCNSFVGMTALKEHKILQEHKRKEESNLSLLSVVDRNRN